MAVGEAAEEGRPGGGRRRWWGPAVGVLLLAVVAAPLLVALAVVWDPPPQPLGDLAQTEMRVRDVPTRHPPLIGLPGRIGTLADQGSHPGPLSFYALWPTYRVLGESPAALAAAAVVSNVAALGVALWAAARRGGSRLALAVGVMLAVLVGAYGGNVLTEPWNPNLPLLWWFAFLLAAWSAVDDDLPMLPVAVVTGSYCMQTHLPYLGLAGAVLLATSLLMVAGAFRRRRQAGANRALIRWGALAVLLGALVWAPPVYEELRGDDGNLSALVDYFSDPPDAVVGPGLAIDTVVDHLNVWNIVTASGSTPLLFTSSSVVPGVLLLAVWAASVLASLRLQAARLLRLHLLVAVVLVAATVSVSRIFGLPSYYLVQWLWVVTLLVVLAVGCTAATVASRLLGPAVDRRAAAVGTGALLAGVLAISAVATADATSTEISHPRLTATFAELLDETVAELRAGSVPGGGRHGRYQVLWDHPVNGSTLGHALVVGLERNGLRAGAPPGAAVQVRGHRVLERGDATAEVHIVAGAALRGLRERPGFREVAHVDPRTRAERRRAEVLVQRVVDDLRQAGLPELAEAVAADDFVRVRADDRAPDGARRDLAELGQIPLPTAVFAGPVGVPG
jgi:hypothetical protein